MIRPLAILLVAGAACFAVAMPASAGPVEVVTALRSAGCGGLPGTAAALGVDVRLDEAARRLSRRRSLDDAMAAAGYRAVKAASIHIRTAHGDAGIERVLADRFCDLLTDPVFRQIGIEQRRDETWMVLAAPFLPPAAADAPAIKRRVLELVNDARSKPRRCGRRPFPAAPPLAASALLEGAALAHARDMAVRGRSGHEGSDGSLPAERVTRVGYRWSAVAENVAAGATTAEQVVADWLASPGHCASLMDGRFAETGIAYAVEPASEDGIYWAQLFAAPP